MSDLVRDQEFRLDCLKLAQHDAAVAKTMVTTARALSAEEMVARAKVYYDFVLLGPEDEEDA